MHDRLNTGLGSLLAWYGRHLPDAVPDTALDSAPLEQQDDDALFVVILVTHNTGCNALLRTLTNRPVLIDVDQASLTVAVRKPGVSDTALDADPSHLYDVKMRASTDHLREPFRPLQYPRETGGIKGLWTLRKLAAAVSTKQAGHEVPTIEVHKAPGLWQAHVDKRRWTASTGT
jgi:hypothetical protein